MGGTWRGVGYFLWEHILQAGISQVSRQAQEGDSRTHIQTWSDVWIRKKAPLGAGLQGWRFQVWGADNVVHGEAARLEKNINFGVCFSKD